MKIAINQALEIIDKYKEFLVVNSNEKSLTGGFKKKNNADSSIIIQAKF